MIHGATRAGTVLIAVVVAAGLWYAKSPEAVQRALSPVQIGSESEHSNLAVYVRKVSWSPDGRKLLSLAHGEVGLYGPLVLHDLDDLPHRKSIDASGESVVTAALSPDGRHVVVATHQGKLWWIELDSDERSLLLELPVGIGFWAVALSADGRQLAATSDDGFIYLCDPKRETAVEFASGLKSRTSGLRFSKDGCWLASAAPDGWLSVWEVQSGKVQQRWKGHDEPAVAVEFLTNEKLISVSFDDTVRIWGIAAGHEIWRGEFGLSRVNALTVSADGSTAAWAGYDRRIVVWDFDNAKKKLQIQVPSSIVWDVQFSPDNKLLAVVGNEGILRIYDAQTGTETERIEVGANSLSHSADAESGRIASATP